MVKCGKEKRIKEREKQKERKKEREREREKKKSAWLTKEGRISVLDRLNNK